MERRWLPRQLSFINRRWSVAAVDSSSSDKVERLSEYEQYFASLLVDTHPDHPDHHHLAHHHHTLTQPLGRVVTAMTMLHAGSAFDP
ncbi:uncharacterized protein [Procambarus clarkii]|uniref:uncharacterized protein isoform X2 n=1 Tax=Procambarus clarkii TaxID=6728 RepID=UPI003742765E